MPKLHEVNHFGVYYRLSLPEHLGDDVERRYRGCGSGFIVVDKATDRVMDMSYASDGVSIVREQNVSMCSDAGRVLAEDDEKIVYRANFSCYTACLF
jgi:hypothetical protein